MKTNIFKLPLVIIGMIMTYTLTIAQNQIWPIGNLSMYYDPVFGPVSNALPTPAGPSGLDYAGQQAQYAANAWHNPQTGALMFFVVDGVVYDCEGYYLGTLNEDNYPGPGLKRIMGFSEVSIVPDPGDCKRFYIIGSSPNASMLNSPPIDAPAANIADVFGEMHFAVVNLGLPRENFNETRMGTLEDLSNSNYVYIQSLRALIPPGQKYANNQNNGWTAVDFLAVSPKNSSNEHLIFYQDHFNIIYTFKLGANGITYVNNSGFDTRSGQSFNNNTNVIIDHVSRSELELIVLPNGNYRVVGLSYNLVYENINNSLATLAANKLYRLDYGSNGNPIQSSFTEHQHYANPSGTGLARIKGIEVSPNKQFVYYTALNTTGLPRSIYCLDMNTFAQVSLPAITDAFSHQFKHSMIERANTGTADGAVYFSHPSGLFQLNSPNDPTIANLTQTVFVNLQMSRLNATAGAFNDDRIGLYLLPDQMDFDPNCQVGCYSFACGDNSAAEACCQFYSGFCSSTNEVVFDDIIVSSTTTWLPGGTINGTTIPANGHFRVTGNITIQPGATLTMNGLYIQFSPKSKVIVSRGATATSTGARLNVRNTTLTAAQICGDCYMWRGIEAQGHNSSSQTASGQSRVSITMNSKIEYAHFGVMAGSISDGNWINWSNHPAYAGARIIASYSTFLNNKYDVFFTDYAHNNTSKFSFCNFITDENLKSNIVLNPIHINIWRNRGIEIRACRFENETPIIQSPMSRGTGIHSLSSNFTVGSFPGQVPSKFNKLKYGVFTTATNSGTNYGIYSSEFNSNFYGIYSQGEQSPIIRNNTFNVFNSAVFQTPLAETYGVYLRSCNRYIVTRNTFTSTTPAEKSVHTFGCVVDNSGPFTNEIRENDFIGLHTGGVTRRQNASLPGKKPFGLQWLCNTFTNDVVNDLWMQSGSNLNQIQGSVLIQLFGGVWVYTSAGNSFNTLANPDVHINMEANVPPIWYIHHQQNGTPQAYTGNVSLTPANQVPSCVGFRSGEYDENDIRAMRLSEYQEKFIVEQHIDFGNTDSLILEVLGEYLTAEQKRDLLKQQGITISDDVILKYIESEPNHQHLYQVLVYNSPLTEKTVHYMMEYSNLPNGMKQQILLLQTGISEYDAKVQVAQEYELNIRYLENKYAEAMLSDSTILYPFDEIIAMYEESPIMNEDVQENLFNLYLITQNATKADSINAILKGIVNDPNYAYMNDLAVASLQTDYYTLLQDSNIVLTLEAIADLHDYRDAARAQALLSGYLGYEFEPLTPMGAKTMVYPKYTYDGSVFETVSIFPNPAQDHFFIVFDENADVSQNREVKVYDLSGVLQFTREMKANDYVLEIKTENMAKGMYLVTISANGKEISTQKVAVR